MSITSISQMQSQNAGQRRVPRKSAPSLASFLYPEPDPRDPFAPLALLRSRVNTSRTSIHRDYPDNSPQSSLPSDCYASVTASLRPINISKQRSLAGMRPCSQDMGYVSEHDFPRMEQKSHYRRRTHSIAVTSESSPYTFHNLQTYILPIAQSPEEDSLSEIPTPTMTPDESSTAISCVSEVGHNDPPESVPRSLSRGVESTASSIKNCETAMPFHSPTWSRVSASHSMSFLPDSSSSPNGYSHNSTGAVPLTPLDIDNELARHTQAKRELFAFPQFSQSSLGQYIPRRSTLSVNVLPTRPSSPSCHVKNMRSRNFVPDPQQTPPEPATFDEIKIPTKRQLAYAASLVVIAENGLRVPFGQVWMEQKTVVCFVRHFWCPLCQDYMFSISTNVDPAALERAGVNLVIISNGSYKMIKFYRQIFGCPFALYTDPTLRLYTAMGMTLRADGEQESQCGSYVRHGHMSGIAMVIKNALRVGMPVWEKGGDTSQLGGEFILGPGLECTFAHRMRTKRGHFPITRVLLAAGLEVVTPVEQEKSVPFDMTLDEEMGKMSVRRRCLEKPRGGRRKGAEICGVQPVARL